MAPEGVSGLSFSTGSSALRGSYSYSLPLHALVPQLEVPPLLFLVPFSAWLQVLCPSQHLPPTPHCRKVERALFGEPPVLYTHTLTEGLFTLAVLLCLSVVPKDNALLEGRVGELHSSYPGPGSAVSVSTVHLLSNFQTTWLLFSLHFPCPYTRKPLKIPLL